MAGSLASANVLVCVPVTREHSCRSLSYGACRLLSPADLDKLGLAVALLGKERIE